MHAIFASPPPGHLFCLYSDARDVPMPPALPLAAPAQRPGSRQEFALMLDAFDRKGGVASGEHVAALVRQHSDQPISTVARWIVAREVLCVEWQGRACLPMFQFDPTRLQPLTGVRESVICLRDALDDWELALWFVRPNAWLDDGAPMDHVVHEPQAVIDAARALRFAALG